MPVIRLNEDLYDRLEKHARGFSTPSQVIEQLLDQVEGVKTKRTSANQELVEPVSKPELNFFPDEDKFHKSLVSGRAARVILHHFDGSTEVKEWHAARFSKTSNLRGNIWSGFLRGWKSKNISSADFYAGQKEKVKKDKS